eukprot:CAMPEP_0117425378 /NCGR_PEP_ID=MMETSP0758-20121206/5641_1 /TAXON_ID=63605 /ORGANISM="Percolomonas cosmopolitus, Strain AE-1 (ATCC 50343)" /LENGTH=532 /DNA_ID=CAMNT_0005209785 /DNA_START=29 /DNA_END=1627 /DNA_ORIENTATION=-
MTTSASDQEIQDELKSMERRLKMLESDQKGGNNDQPIEPQQESLENMKKENKELKQSLAKLLREQGRKGKSYQQAELEKLETKVHQLRLTYDDLKYKVKTCMKQIKTKQDTLRDIRRESKPILTEDSPLTRQIRILENRLDKAMIKYNEAQSIKKTYTAILKRLKNERIGFDNQLQAIERTLKAKEHDFQELRNMYHEANYLKELAKSELLEANQEFEEMKKQKEKELQEKKGYVQARIEMTGKITKREQQRRKMELQAQGLLDANDEQKLQTASFAQIFQGATNDSKIAQEQEKLLKLEATWRKIKEVTGVNDANEVIQKYLSSADTHRNLQHMTKEAQDKIDQLNEKKENLKNKLEDIKYSQSNGLGSRRIVDEFVQQLNEAKTKSERNRQHYERVAKILINVKAGIEHLADKLRPLDENGEIEIVTLEENQNEGEYIRALLGECEQRLMVLMKDVDPEALDEEVEEDEEEGTAYHITDNNIRISLGEEDQEEDEEEYEEDDTDVLDRAQVKKLALLAIEKRKKKKKERT